jgi:NADPH:quinone reductase-like Zn-dependent oxidoreductase
LATASTTIPIPDSLSFTDASVLPQSVSTAGAALYEKNMFAFSYPSNDVTPRDGEVVFVWGGSSSVGSSAIQLARASGYEVFTTASKHNHDKVSELGATHIFDHATPTVVDDVNAALKGKKLVGVFDCISKDETIAASSKIAKTAGLDKIIGVLPGKEGKEEGVEYKSVFGASPQSSEVGPAVYANYLKEALEKGTFLARPKPEVVGHGLEYVQQGLDTLKGGVSAKKLVVTL